MMGDLTGHALVIAGHGSLNNPNTRLPICQAVRQVRELGLFDEVVCGLWKERPYFREVLPRLWSHRVTVVPMFMSEGFYTQIVIPREFGLSGQVSMVDGKLIRCTRPLGTHARLAEVILHRACESRLSEPETLIVLGHGTPRNPESGKTTEDQAALVRHAGVFPEVLTAFIDQAPYIQDVIPQARQEHVVIVPFFVGDGWHVTETVTEDLGIEDGATTWQGKQVRYTGAVGTDPTLFRVILELAGVPEGEGPES